MQLELFSAYRSHFWGVLKDAFPTNIHPDNILIEPLGEGKENRGAYVSRALQTRRDVTGNDPDTNQMEQSSLIVLDKIQQELPIPVRSNLAKVACLGNIVKNVYIDHIACQVEVNRKKEQDKKNQDEV